MKVLVTESLSERGLEVLQEDFEVDVRKELAKGDLPGEIAPYDALIVRSATQVTPQVIEAGDNLKVVARAGIGLDNVDVEAATRRGIMVLNAPQSNIVSAAEHTIALLLAQARHIPQACASLKGGAWDRSKYQGVELQGKTLGLVGLGRVGSLVAQRMVPFGVRVIAFDPYVSRDKAREIEVEMMPTLEALLVQSDVVSIHLPRTPETEKLIGRKELAMMKEGSRLVNTARGSIVDEDALVEALKSGHLAGAGIDVFSTELDNVVVTPHLGASTVEAQDKAGVTIAQMVRLALRGEFVPYAVNLSAGDVPELVRPFLGIAEKLGALLTGLAPGSIESIDCQYMGRLAEVDTRVLTLAALKGALGAVVHEPLSLVNAPLVAQEHGIAVNESKASVSRDYVNLIALKAKGDGEEVTVAGTLLSKRVGRFVNVLDFDVDIAPTRYMLFLVYDDVPGIIGQVGTMIGAQGINIGGMDVGRKAQGDIAVMGLTLDSPLAQDALDGIVKAVDAKYARFVTLPE